MATTSGSASTPCKGHAGGSCCQTTGSGTRRGKSTDGSTVVMGIWVRLALLWLLRGKSGPGWCLLPGLPSRLCAGAACQSWRLLEEWIFREILRVPHLIRQWILFFEGLRRIRHIFYVEVNSNPEAFRSPFSRRLEKCAQSMLLVAASLSAVRTLEVDIISMSGPFWQFAVVFAASCSIFQGPR